MSTTELWQSILQTVVLALVGALCTALTAAITKWFSSLKAKVTNQKVTQALVLLEDLATTCVLETTQTYVDNLKDKNMFDEEAQKHALDMTKAKIMSLLTPEVKQTLIGAVGDLGTYIVSLIEERVHISKE